MKNEGFLPEVERLLNEVLGEPAGSEVLVDICQRYSGNLVYIPSKTALQLHLRNEEIRSNFRGDNYLELAASYGLAYSRIWTIINQADSGRSFSALSIKSVKPIR